MGALLITLLFVLPGLPVHIYFVRSRNVTYETAFQVILLSIISVSSASLVLLFTESFSIRNLCLLQLIPIAVICLLPGFSETCKRMRVSIKTPVRQFAIFAGIFLVGLIFRVPTSPYVIFDQDPGSYVNIGHHFLSAGKIPYEDPLVPLYDRCPDLKEEYFSQTYIKRHTVQSGWFEGALTPGIYTADFATGKNIPQFYPLHPLLLGLSSGILGTERTTCIMLLFSMCSMVLLYLITKRLTGRKTASYLAMLLMAVNPGGAYFSKNPVSENLSVFLILSVVYFILLAFRDDNGRHVLFALCATAGLVLLAATRVDLFLFLPVFGFLFIYGLLLEKESPRISSSLILSWGYIVALMICVLIGVYFSFPYFNNIYDELSHAFFGRDFLSTYPLFIACFGALILAMGLAHVFRRRLVLPARAVWRFVTVRPGMIASLITACLFAAVAFRLYSIVFGKSFVGDDWFDNRWDVANHGIDTFFYTGVSTVIGYLSWAGFFLLPFAFCLLIKRAITNIAYLLPILLATWFFLFNLAINRAGLLVPYCMYYSRYLFNPLIPFALMALAILLAEFWQKGRLIRVVGVLLTILTLYPLFAVTYKQSKADDLADLYAFQRGINDEFYSNSTFFFIDDDLRYELAMPLRFIYGRPTYVFTDAKQVLANKSHLDYLQKHGFRNIIVLSRAPLPFGSFKRIRKDCVPFTYLKREKGRFPATSICHKKSFGLYRFDPQPSDYEKTKIFIPHEYPEKLSGFYGDAYLWTDGHADISNINMNIEDGLNYLVIESCGDHICSQDTERLNLQVYLNGMRLPFRQRHKDDFYFSLPDNETVIDSLRVTSVTFIPAELGYNDDRRSLGVPIKAISLKTSAPAEP